MPKATVEVKITFLKKSTASSTDLPTSQKIPLSQGNSFFVTQYSPAANQHLYLTLASPLTAQDGKTKLQAVYAYAPHIKIEDSNLNVPIRLNVTYRSQLDNDTDIFGSGARQCNLTSNTMLADFLLKGELAAKAMAGNYNPPEPETVYGKILSKYGDTTDSDAQTAALKELGIDSYFSMTLSAADLIASLRAGVPIVIGVSYKASGHFILIVGYDPVKQIWLAHDPYGTRYGSSDSYDVGVGGEFDAYSYETLQKIFFDMGSEAGWGRIVTSVRGKPTGLPRGL
jgi:hypothetical protein